MLSLHRASCTQNLRGFILGSLPFKWLPHQLPLILGILQNLLKCVKSKEIPPNAALIYEEIRPSGAIKQQLNLTALKHVKDDCKIPAMVKTQGKPAVKVSSLGAIDPFLGS